MQLNFQEGLPFLNKYVEAARAQGAREYKKMQTTGVVENQVNFLPYPTKKMASDFQSFLNEYNQNYLENKSNKAKQKNLQQPILLNPKQ